MTWKNCQSCNEPTSKLSFRDALLSGLSSSSSLSTSFSNGGFVEAKPKVLQPPKGFIALPPEILTPPEGYNINPRKPLPIISKHEIIPNPTTPFFRIASRPTRPKKPVLFKIGENGCLEYTNEGLGSPILAISQLVRNGNPQSLMKHVLQEGDTTTIVDIIVLLFVTRNSRGGKGEKKLSYDMFLTLWKYYPKTAKNLLVLFPHYGYWKDLFLLMEYSKELPFADDLYSESHKIILEQFKLDVQAMQSFEQEKRDSEGPISSTDNKDDKKKPAVSPRISLLAKWLPRERSSVDKKINFVKTFVDLLYPPEQEQPQKLANNNNNNDDDDDENEWKSASKSAYRKQVSQLTKYLDLPEVLLSAQQADEIKIGRLASRAIKLLTKAMLNENKPNPVNDPKRQLLRQKFISYTAKKGLKGGQIMPHEIVHQILYTGNFPSESERLVMQAQWNDLWKQVMEETKTKSQEQGLEFIPTRMVPICDVSGSMYGTPMEVCIALGIGISEITHEAFRNMVLTFSATPQWHRLDPSHSIFDKVKSLKMAKWGMNTNFAKAYDQILQVCLRYKLKREDVPALIVFSDMQFDQASQHGAHSRRIMFDVIKEKFKRVGKQLGWKDREPTPIIFWNLRNTGRHPVSKSTEGTVLLSGFSPSLLKLVMNGEALKEDEIEIVEKDGTTRKEKIRVTPEQIMQKMLNDPIYDPVRQILAESTEGALADYCPSLLAAETVKVEFVIDNKEEKKDKQTKDDFVLV